MEKWEFEPTHCKMRALAMLHMLHRVPHGGRIVFVGDSQARNAYNAFLDLLTGWNFDQHPWRTAVQASDASFPVEKVMQHVSVTGGTCPNMDEYTAPGNVPRPPPDWVGATTLFPNCSRSRTTGWNDFSVQASMSYHPPHLQQAHTLFNVSVELYWCVDLSHWLTSVARAPRYRNWKYPKNCTQDLNAWGRRYLRVFLDNNCTTAEAYVHAAAAGRLAPTQGTSAYVHSVSAPRHSVLHPKTVVRHGPPKPLAIILNWPTVEYKHYGTRWIPPFAHLSQRYPRQILFSNHIPFLRDILHRRGLYHMRNGTRLSPIRHFVDSSGAMVKRFFYDKEHIAGPGVAINAHLLMNGLFQLIQG